MELGTGTQRSAVSRLVDGQLIGKARRTSRPPAGRSVTALVGHVGAHDGLHVVGAVSNSADKMMRAMKNNLPSACNGAIESRIRTQGNPTPEVQCDGTMRG